MLDYLFCLLVFQQTIYTYFIVVYNYYNLTIADLIHIENLSKSSIREIINILNE